MSRGRPTPAINMTNRQREILEVYSKKNTIPNDQLTRVNILLLASKGKNNMEISRLLGITVNRIKKWRGRWTSSYDKLLIFELGIDNKGVSDKDLLERMLSSIKDLPRSGTPKQISLSQENQIIAISCKKPKDFGIIMNKWTHEQIANTAIAQGVIDTISTRSIGYILKKTNFDLIKTTTGYFQK